MMTFWRQLWLIKPAELSTQRKRESERGWERESKRVRGRHVWTLDGCNSYLGFNFQTFRMLRMLSTLFASAWNYFKFWNFAPLRKVLYFIYPVGRLSSGLYILSVKLFKRCKIRSKKRVLSFIAGYTSVWRLLVCETFVFMTVGMYIVSTVYSEDSQIVRQLKFLGHQAIRRHIICAAICQTRLDSTARPTLCFIIRIYSQICAWIRLSDACECFKKG